MEAKQNPGYPSQLKKVLAVAIIPVFFYLSGAFVVLKILNLSGVKPLWSDYSFFHTINQGLGLYSGNILQCFWLVIVLLALLAPFVIKRLPFYPILSLIFSFLLVISYVSSIQAAKDTMANLKPVEFKFEQADRIPQIVVQSNQHHELKLIYVGAIDYLVARSSTKSSPVKGIRIPDNEISSLTVNN